MRLELRRKRGCISKYLGNFVDFFYAVNLRFHVSPQLICTRILSRALARGAPASRSVLFRSEARQFLSRKLLATIRKSSFPFVFVSTIPLKHLFFGAANGVVSVFWGSRTDSLRQIWPCFARETRKLNEPLPMESLFLLKNRRFFCQIFFRFRAFHFPLCTPWVLLNNRTDLEAWARAVRAQKIADEVPLYFFKSSHQSGVSRVWKNFKIWCKKMRFFVLFFVWILSFLACFFSGFFGEIFLI